MQTSHQQPLVQSENKQKIRNGFKELRTACERSDNWSAIQPILDKFQGDLDNFFAAAESS